MVRTPVLFQCLPFLLIAVSLQSCSSSLSPESPKRAAISPEDVEYLDREQVVLEEVQAHPTAFTVSPEQESEVWKRTTLLAKAYVNTDSKRKVLKDFSPSGFHIRHFPSRKEGTAAPAFAYEILGQRVSGGASQDSPLRIQVFAVNVLTGRRDSQAVLLAKNISRFLRTGVLERSLLNSL